MSAVPWRERERGEEGESGRTGKLFGTELQDGFTPLMALICTVHLDLLWFPLWADVFLPINSTTKTNVRPREVRHVRTVIQGKRKHSTAALWPDVAGYLCGQ